MPRQDSGLPQVEAERLDPPGRLHVFGAGPKAHFEALCRTARDLFVAPIALVSFLDEHDQWFQARSGPSMPSIAHDVAFCTHTVLSDDVFVVEDAAEDPRFCANPLVLGAMHIRLYAGAPLVLSPGVRAGTICIMDTRPRTFSVENRTQLAGLATIAVAHLRLREAQIASEARAREHQAREAAIAIHNQDLTIRENRLRETNDLLSLAETLADMGHWRINISTGMVQSSAGFETIFGRDATEGRFNIADHGAVIHPDDRDRTLKKIARLNTGEIDSYENRARLIRPNGDSRVIISRAVAERNPAGQVESVFGVCMDVTELARAEDQLREKTALLANTLDHMDQGLIVMDSELRLILINRRALHLLDLPEAWLVQKPTLAEAMDYQNRRDEWSASDDAMRAYAAAGGCKVEYHTYERVRPNGTVLEVHTVPLADGSVVRTFTDITARRAAERAVRESETHYRLLADATSDLILRRNVNGVTSYISPASREVLGYAPDELIQIPLETLFHPEDLGKALPVIADLRSGTLERASVTYRVRHKDGRWVWIESRARLIHDENGAPSEIISAWRDVCEKMAVEERLAFALDGGSDGLWDWNIASGAVWRSGRCWDKVRRVSDVSEDFEAMMNGLVHSEDRARLMSDLDKHLRQEIATLESEFRMHTAIGSFIWVLARGKVVERGADGRAMRMVGTVVDITARKEAETRISYMARHDTLTDLPNRVQFRDQLGRRLAEVERSGGILAVLCLNLDRFKAVNDTLGHPAGDAVLREIARRLKSATRFEDIVARLGGDEFAVLLSTSRALDSRRIDSFAERLIEIVNQPVVVDGQDVTIGLTIGVAVSPADGLEADALFKRADLALYQAKAEGRNTFRFFEAGMDEAMAERRRLEIGLRGALARHELELHYQPVLDTARGGFSSFEALIRWRHPDRGLVSPTVFIPIAEEVGLIVPIGEWVLQRACRDAMTWGDQSLKVSVNISAAQFRHDGLILSIAAALQASGLPAARLEIEITESVLIGNDEVVLDIVRSIRGMGIGIALDDFGTGYSSLSYLHRFPFDRVKIDRGFVKDIARPRTAAIVRATVDLAERLGMAVTAEGIETTDQLHLVKAEGCTEIQGYLISRPVQAAEAFRMARKPRTETLPVEATRSHHQTDKGSAAPVMGTSPNRRRKPKSGRGTLGSAVKVHLTTPPATSSA